MCIKQKNAFTLIELVFVVLMLWILIMATTMYLDWSWERRKIIEWQWCASSIWGKLNNYIFYTLTSKNLKTESNSISPDFYIIQLTWWNWWLCTGGNTCNEINLNYQTWDIPTQNYKTYETLNISKTCYQSKQPLKFYRNTDNKTDIIMSKWFTSQKDNTSVFYITWSELPIYTWDILIDLCLNKECSASKQISKFVVDWRSQTISIRNCRIYSGDDTTKCEKRDWENLEEISSDNVNDETNDE